MKNGSHEDTKTQGADRPILFSAPMVRAILEGRKTQTRRIIKPCPWPEDLEPPYIAPYPEGARAVWCDSYDCSVHLAAPFVVGERLWVKETWRTWKDCDRIKPVDLPKFGAPVFYEADRDNCDRHGKIRVSIHMPRWASRLTLAVTDVRVERLQDISEADAIAEGIYWQRNLGWTTDGETGSTETARLEYGGLWNRINGAGAWESNPWVVAVSFDVQQRNIDQ